MKKILFAGTALVALSASASAFAADLPARTATAAAPLPVFSWTGAYVGATLGGSLVTSDFVDPTESLSYPGISNKGIGANIGATLGYNYQIVSAVVGMEGDLSWANFKKSSYGYDKNATIDSKWNWFSTVRGRIGYAMGNVLVYGTGGLAIVGIDHKAQYGDGYMCGSASGYNSCVKKASLGLAIGAGMEFALNKNVTLKGEYLYISLKSQNTVGGGSPFGWNDSANLVRFGSNYKF